MILHKIFHLATFISGSSINRNPQCQRIANVANESKAQYTLYNVNGT